MTRVYARGFGGARIHESAPQGNWKILTILGALSTRGMIAAMTIEEATDTDIFPAYHRRTAATAHPENAAAWFHHAPG